MLLPGTEGLCHLAQRHCPWTGSGPGEWPRQPAQASGGQDGLCSVGLVAWRRKDPCSCPRPRWGFTLAGCGSACAVVLHCMVPTVPSLWELCPRAFSQESRQMKPTTSLDQQVSRGPGVTAVHDRGRHGEGSLAFGAGSRVRVPVEVGWGDSMKLDDAC